MKGFSRNVGLGYELQSIYRENINSDALMKISSDFLYFERWIVIFNNP